MKGKAMKTKLLRTAALAAIALMGTEVSVFANESMPLAMPGHVGMPADHGSVERLDGMSGHAASDDQTAAPRRYGKGPTRGGRRGGGCG
jgi:hypothetical protein